MSSTPVVRALGAAVGIAALLTLLLSAFAWPTHELEPRGLPLAVVGPEQALAQVERATAPLGEDALDLTSVDTRDDAIAAIQEREVYAAIVPGPSRTELMTAPAGSPAVATLLREALARAAPTPPTVTAVVPLPNEDPRGAVFSSGALPLVLGGIITGGAFSLLVRQPGAAITGVLVTAALAGLSLTAVLQEWLGALSGDFAINAGVVGLGVAAVGLAVLGLFRFLGRGGLALGALTMLLLGNPLSGITSAPELLPWGPLGQLLPPGATGTALRSTAFFDGNGAAQPLLVLAVWVLAGIALALLPIRRPPEGRTAPVGDEGRAGRMPARS